MATPALVLRFRDTTPGVDTIAEHRKIIEVAGHVGWGWWKKTFESANTGRIVAQIQREGSIGILLIDRTTERAFLSRCTGFAESRYAKPEIVPDYYREHIGEIAGLFILESIVEIEFDRAISDSIREQTLLWIGETPDPSLGHVASAANAPERGCILHISDLHFGDDYGFRRQDEDIQIGDGRRTLTECIVNDLNRLGLKDDIAAIIVTGDFMTRGRWNDATKNAALAEFDSLRANLNLNKDQIIAVPGNHDVVRYPEANVDASRYSVENQTTYEHETMFRTFIDSLIGRNWKASLNYVQRVHLQDADIDICVLNSCTIAATVWTEYGYVGRNGLDAISDLNNRPVERPTFRFLALHHHLLPVNNVEAPESKGVTLTLDASEILTASQQSNVNVILHGHQHKPKISRYQNVALNGERACPPVHIVSNGSAGARNDRLPPGERNTYCLFRLAENAIHLWMRELRLDGAPGAQIYHGRLNTMPIHPQPKKQPN